MLKFQEKDDVLIACFEETDRFNALVAEGVKEELKSKFETAGVKLVLNLEKISFIDSTGFGVFLSVLKSANSNSGQFKIACISTTVMELFKLLQLHNVFELYNSLDDAVDSFN